MMTILLCKTFGTHIHRCQWTEINFSNSPFNPSTLECFQSKRKASSLTTNSTEKHLKLLAPLKPIIQCDTNTKSLLYSSVATLPMFKHLQKKCFLEETDVTNKGLMK